jgi:hypothetical protein
MVSVPTAQTSFGPVPQTDFRSWLVPLGLGAHIEPSQWRIVPSSPTAHTSLAPDPQMAASELPCGIGYVQHQPSLEQIPGVPPSIAGTVAPVPSDVGPAPFTRPPQAASNTDAHRTNRNAPKVTAYGTSTLGVMTRGLLTEIDKQPQLRGDADVHDAVGLGVYLADGNLPAHARAADPVRKSPRIRCVHCRVHQVRFEMRLA